MAMKKLIIAAAVLGTLGIAACGGDDKKDEAKEGAEKAEEAVEGATEAAAE